MITFPKTLMMKSIILHLALVISIFIFNLNTVSAHQQKEINKTNFNSLAQELMDGLNDALLNDFSTRSGYGRPGIKISSFKVSRYENTKALTNLANEYNARLLAALINISDGRFKFIAEVDKFRIEKLKDLCTDLDNCPGDRNSSYYGPEADILITGSLRILGHKAFLTYQATGTENGLILAATSRTSITLPHKFHHRLSSPIYRLPKNYSSSLIAEEFRHSCTQIKKFQRYLKTLGYRPGRINGKISLATREAIKAFQWHHNIPETGNYSCSLFWQVKAQMPVDSRW
tara:strand:+ start:294 stop:1157 length:864 start_codon:yes stop_codon:yes gene_type:complete